MASDRLPRVQIVNRKHPHFEEYGRFTGKIINRRERRPARGATFVRPRKVKETTNGD